MQKVLAIKSEYLELCHFLFMSLFSLRRQKRLYYLLLEDFSLMAEGVNRFK